LSLENPAPELGAARRQDDLAAPAGADRDAGREGPAREPARRERDGDRGARALLRRVQRQPAPARRARRGGPLGERPAGLLRARRPQRLPLDHELARRRERERLDGGGGEATVARDDEAVAERGRPAAGLPEQAIERVAVPARDLDGAGRGIVREVEAVV